MGKTVTSIYRNDYREALGEFLLTFNATENLLNEIVSLLLDRLSKSHLYKEGDMFDRKLGQLELLCEAFKPKMHTPDFERLRTVNSRRNELAHGHMRTDPNTGEVDIIKAQTSRWKTGKKISPETIRKNTTLATAAHDDLSQMMPFIWFAHTPPPIKPEGAI